MQNGGGGSLRQSDVSYGYRDYGGDDSHTQRMTDGTAGSGDGGLF